MAGADADDMLETAEQLEKCADRSLAARDGSRCGSGMGVAQGSARLLLRIEWSRGTA